MIIMYSDHSSQFQKAQQYREQPRRFFHKVDDKTFECADGDGSYRLRRNGGGVWQCECLYARNSNWSCGHVSALEWMLAQDPERSQTTERPRELAGGPL